MRSDWRVHGIFLVLLLFLFGALVHGIERRESHEPPSPQPLPVVPLHRVVVDGTIPLAMGETKKVSLTVPNRDYLEGYLDALVGSRLLTYPLLTLSQSCGAIYTFQTTADLPDKTLPCHCHKKGCVVIRYTRG